MLAAVFAREGHLELQERPQPSISRDDQVLLQVEGCGICGTDLHILERPPGHPATAGVILGHEFIGTVIDRGAAARALPHGARVAVAPNITCGRCAMCRGGRPNQCGRFSTLGIFVDGGLAPYAVVPALNCHVLSRDITFEDAVWTEVLSCVVNSVSQAQARAGGSVLVLGGGPAGALHALLFTALGARVLVADLVAPRLAILQRAGVDAVADLTREPLADVLASFAPDGADVVVDAVGDQFGAAVDAAACGGRIVLFGMNSAVAPGVKQNLITRRELTIVGSYVGVNTFPQAIDLLERKVIAPSSLEAATFPLDGVGAAFDLLGTKSIMKVIIRH